MVIVFMVQSCTSPRYISQENDLKQRFIGTKVDDVIAVYGAPHGRESIDSRYALTYYLDGHNAEGYYGQRYTRFNFDENDVVTNVLSDVTAQGKQFNAGGTAFCVILGIGAAIAIPVLLVKSAIK